MSISRWTDNEYGIHTHNGVLFTCKKKLKYEIFRKMNISEKQSIKWGDPNTENPKLHVLPYLQILAYNVCMSVCKEAYVLVKSKNLERRPKGCNIRWWGRRVGNRTCRTQRGKDGELAATQQTERAGGRKGKENPKNSVWKCHTGSNTLRANLNFILHVPQPSADLLISDTPLPHIFPNILKGTFPMWVFRTLTHVS